MIACLVFFSYWIVMVVLGLSFQCLLEEFVFDLWRSQVFDVLMPVKGSIKEGFESLLLLKNFTCFC